MLTKTTLVSKIFKKDDKNFGVNFVGTLSYLDIFIFWRVFVMRDRNFDISCRDIVYQTPCELSCTT